MIYSIMLPRITRKKSRTVTWQKAPPSLFCEVVTWDGLDQLWSDLGKGVPVEAKVQVRDWMASSLDETLQKGQLS